MRAARPDHVIYGFGAMRMFLAAGREAALAHGTQNLLDSGRRSRPGS